MYAIMSQDEIICFDIFGLTITLSISIHEYKAATYPLENKPSIGYHGNQNLMIYNLEKYMLNHLP